MRGGNSEHHNFQDHCLSTTAPAVVIASDNKEVGESECHRKISKMKAKFDVSICTWLIRVVKQGEGLTSSAAQSKQLSFMQIALIRAILVVTIAAQVFAQYEHQHQQQIYDRYGSSPMMAQNGYVYAGGHGGGGEYEHGGYEADERPKVHLGIRLRIPAFRFELPRFNMPKITVNAKIRQPNRPRVITLPEINLDTSSKVAPPGSAGESGKYQAAGGGEGYGGYSSPSQSYANYHSQPQGGTSENEFTFSTSGDDSNHGQYGHATSGGYMNRYQYSPHQHQQQRYNQASHANAMSSAPAYPRPPQQQQQAAYQTQSQHQQQYERPSSYQQPNYAMISASQQSATRVPPAQNETANPYIGFDDDIRK